MSVGKRYQGQWLLDSGATSHMSPNKEWFNEFEAYDKPATCMAGDGFGLEILGRGTIKVSSQLENDKVILVLRNVLYIPQLASNLISVGAAADQGIDTIFKGNHCEMTKGGTKLAKGVKMADEGVYLMKVDVVSSNALALMMSKKKSLDEWHRILGHPGSPRLKGLLNQLEIDYKDGGKIECPEGKGQHVVHPGVGRIASAPGVIHSDLAFVNKASLEGERYFLVCKDEASEFVMIFPLQSKDQVAAKLALMAIEFESISGCRVRHLKCDNGNEFINQTTKLWCLRGKIHLTTSAPYTPQQNGVAEREVRTVTEIARTLLLASKLPSELWSAAVLTAAYLKNRLPTTRDSITPQSEM